MSLNAYHVVQHRRGPAAKGELIEHAAGTATEAATDLHAGMASLEVDSDHVPLLMESSNNGGVATGTTPTTQTTGTASQIQVAFNMVISFVGAGMLGMPHAFAESGWVLGCVALAFVSAVNVYAMLLLVQCRQRLTVQQQDLVEKDGVVPAPIAGYGDVGRHILGPTGEWIVNICLVVSQIGFATAYLIFVAANAWKLAAIPASTVCLACIPLLALLVQAREMKTLSPVSLIADVANALALSTILVQDYHHVQYEEPNAQDSDEEDIVTANYSRLLYVVAISLYSLEGVGMILPLESSAKHPQEFPNLLKGVLLGITVFMAIFGTAGYWAFGTETMAPITLNITGKAGTFVQLALCLALYLTYPIMMVPVHGVMEGVWPSLKTNSLQRILTRSGLVVFSAYVAYAVPDFGKFLSLVGSSICVLLGFIFPSLFHLILFRGTKELPYWEVGLDVVLILGGTLFGIVGTYQSFCALLNGEAIEHLR